MPVLSSIYRESLFVNYSYGNTGLRRVNCVSFGGRGRATFGESGPTGTARSSLSAEGIWNRSVPYGGKGAGSSNESGEANSGLSCRVLRGERRLSVGGTAGVLRRQRNRRGCPAGQIHGDARCCVPRRQN